MELETGRAVDRYVVEGRLGEGGMAVVYKVRHNRLGSLHALKVLSVPMGSVRERLLREGRVQASLRHPNVVSVTDIVEVDGSPGLIMEYVNGPSLEALLRRHRPNLAEAEALAYGIVAGVACAHREGIIHRDLKPANVLLLPTDLGPVPKVADFGLVKVLAGDEGGPIHRTRSGLAMGTPAYMAPEQIRNAKAVDHRADVFSLGALLYELFVGRAAFPGDDLLDVFNITAAGAFVPPSEAAPHLPGRIARAISGALAPDRDRRIADCDSLVATLRGDVPPTALVGFGTGGFSPAMKEALTVESTTLLPADAASPTPTFDPRTLLPAPPAPARRAHSRLPLLGALAVTLIGAAGWILAGEDPPAPSSPPPPAALQVAAPVVSTPPPIADTPVPMVAPEEPLPAPRRAQRTAATPVPTAPPAPADPAPTPAPAPAPVETRVTATVRVSGDASRVWLQNEQGRFPAGEVAPGTYQLVVFFDGVEPVDAGEIVLAAGESRELRCLRKLMMCR